MSAGRFTYPLVIAALFAVACVLGCGRSEQAKPAAQKQAQKQKPAAHVHDHGDGSGPHSHGADAHDAVVTEKDVKRPADYKDALARIKQYRDRIERDTATDTPGLAHRPLDELDFVLKWLPGIARDSNVPKSQWEAINATSKELRELFDKVHKNIDEQKAPDFGSVKAAVEQAIQKLEAAAGAAPEKP